LRRYALEGIISMATSDDEPGKIKPVTWVGSSRKDMRKFPKEVRLTFGQALFDAQTGRKHPDAKPWRGFGGAGVMAVTEDHDGSTYRCVFMVKFPEAVYVLHAFQKKSKAGSKTPPGDVEKVRKRLKEAEEHYAAWAEEERRRDEGRR
jgi:phage-related protein